MNIMTKIVRSGKAFDVVDELTGEVLHEFSGEESAEQIAQRLIAKAAEQSSRAYKAERALRQSMDITEVLRSLEKTRAYFILNNPYAKDEHEEALLGKFRHDLKEHFEEYDKPEDGYRSAAFLLELVMGLIVPTLERVEDGHSIIRWGETDLETGATKFYLTSNSVPYTEAEFSNLADAVQAQRFAEQKSEVNRETRTGHTEDCCICGAQMSEYSNGSQKYLLDKDGKHHVTDGSCAPSQAVQI